MRSIRSLSMCAGLLCGLVLAGCEQPPQPILTGADLGPQLDAEGYHRSLVLDAPLLDHLTARQPQHDGLAWYDSRNDRTLAADAGYAAPEIQTSNRLVRDRQTSSGGRVRDSFTITTYRTEARQFVR